MTAINTSHYADLGLSLPGQAEKSQTELGQEDFLKLMIEQVRHQDPLDPSENTDFVAQMAQFGTVSGIAELQTSFDNFAEVMRSEQVLQGAGLVGREVMYAGDVATLDGDDPMQGAVEVPTGASTVLVKIYGQNGEKVAELDLGTRSQGLADFSWDGTKDNGDTASPGTYIFTAQALLGGQQEMLPTYGSGKVNSVSIGDNNTVLEISSIGGLNLSEIHRIMN